MFVRKPTQHHMARRSVAHNYSRPGIYHITVHVADGMGQPLGRVDGNDADSARVALTAAGAAVEHELLTAITAHYPMVTVDTYVVMPEHLHFILNVRKDIVSRNGRSTHLGQIIAGFKKGCNRVFWALTAQSSAQASSQAPAGAASQAAAGASAHSAAQAAAGEPQGTVSGGSPARTTRPPSSGSTGRVPLFAYGYCDVMPVEAGQLERQRAYIQDNPRSRWLRTHDPARLQVQRAGINTALKPAALRGFLQRECPPSLVGTDALAALEDRLLLADGFIVCQSYGDRALLERRLLPVVCHRKDKARFKAQKARCLAEAAAGTVLVSARIAAGEQAIMDAAANHGYPVILLADNGFPERYHPSAERIVLCAASRLLLLSPWQYQYRGKNESISVPFCKTMNCIAQALCRQKDSWWQAS